MPNHLRETQPGVKVVRTTYERPYVQQLFDRIAFRYDLLNHLLSLSLDIKWRNKAASLLERYEPQTILDVATGTADMALAMSRLRPKEIRGVDISREMLTLGREKIARRGLQSLIALEEGSAERLRFQDCTFDAVTVAFGIRNFTGLGCGLAEMYRVLRPGGVTIILEFSRPEHAPFRQLYGFYFKRILPLIGGMVSKSREAYDYLPRTIEEFPQGEELLEHLGAAGFAQRRHYPVTFGVATIYVAEKPV